CYKANRKCRKITAIICKVPLKMSLAIFPKIKGTTIKNEKRAALVLSLPSKTDVDMVAPEREIPGSIAMAWETPMTKAFLNDTFLSVSLALTARNNRMAVINNIQPTNKILPPKRHSNCSSKNTPTIRSEERRVGKESKTRRM